MKKKQLDLRRVPLQYLRFVWLTHIVDDFDEIIISKLQSEAIFCSLAGVWRAYKGIPLIIKGLEKLKK